MRIIWLMDGSLVWDLPTTSFWHSDAVGGPSTPTGRQMWPWVPDISLTRNSGMTMRRWSPRFDQVGICSSADGNIGGETPPSRSPNRGSNAHDQKPVAADAQERAVEGGVSPHLGRRARASRSRRAAG